MPSRVADVEWLLGFARQGDWQVVTDDPGPPYERITRDRASDPATFEKAVEIIRLHGWGGRPHPSFSLQARHLDLDGNRYWTTVGGVTPDVCRRSI